MLIIIYDIIYLSKKKVSFSEPDQKGQILQPSVLFIRFTEATSMVWLIIVRILLPQSKWKIGTVKELGHNWNVFKYHVVSHRGSSCLENKYFVNMLLVMKHVSIIILSVAASTITGLPRRYQTFKWPIFLGVNAGKKKQQL